MNSVRYTIWISLTFYIFKGLLKHLKFSVWLTLNSIVLEEILISISYFGDKAAVNLFPLLMKWACQYCFFVLILLWWEPKCVKVACQHVSAKLSKISVLNIKILPVYFGRQDLCQIFSVLGGTCFKSPDVALLVPSLSKFSNS